MFTRMFAPLAFAAAAAVSLTTAGPAAAQELSLAQISNYLNSIGEANAEFTQANADGSTSTGTLYIHRPGRMRFEYNPPNKALVIAGGNSVAIFDPKSNQGPQQYPLGQTPLKLILGTNIDLTTAKMVVTHRANGDQTIVVAQDPKHPDYGNIALYFSDQPVVLTTWVVTDQTGTPTRVTLKDLHPVQSLGDSLFDIPLAIQRRK